MLKVSIDIVSDVICPWCFIGKRRLERALAAAPSDIAVQVGWRPYQLNPDMPAEGMDRRRYLAEKFGGEARAERVYQNVVDAGAGEGIAFDFKAIQRTPNTIDAHRLIDRAGRDGRQDALVERLFRGYFLEGRDLSDREGLVAMAAEAGLPEEETRHFLSGHDGVERVASEDAMARRMGIQGVPCFIFNRKYAVSGAQDPAVFAEVFEALRREAEASPEPANAP
jgi:predicted DsbA family dithiol-disulfide isomerase